MRESIVQEEVAEVEKERCECEQFFVRGREDREEREGEGVCEGEIEGGGGGGRVDGSVLV